MNKTFLLVILFLMGISNINAQDNIKIDSLLGVVNDGIDQRDAVDIYINIAEEFAYTDSAQTAFYVDKAIQLSKKIYYQEGEINALYWLGWTYMTNHHYDNSKDLYESILKQSQKIGYSAGVRKSYNGLGNNYYNSSNYQLALESFEKELDIIINETHELKSRISAYYNIARCYKTLGNYTKALACLELAMTDALQLKEVKLQVYILNIFGQVYMRLGEYEKSIEYYDRAIELAKINKFDFSLYYINSANVYQIKGNYSKAIEIYKTYLKESELSEIKNLARIAQSNNNIGTIYLEQGELAKALEYLLIGLKLRKETNNITGIATSLTNIGYCYQTQGDYDNALKYYFESLKIDKQTGGPIGLILNYDNIGSVYYLMANYDSSISYHQKSIGIALEHGNTEYVAVGNLSIGKALIAKASFDRAMEVLLRSKTIFLQIGSLPRLGENLIALGEVYKAVGNNKEAHKNLMEGINILKGIGNKIYLKRGLYLLSQVEADRKNYKEAFDTYQQYHAYYDSLLGEEKGKELSRLQVQFETERKEQTIKNLEQQASINELQLRQTTLKMSMLAVVIVVIVLIGIIFYMISRQKRGRLKQAAQEMEQRLLRTQMTPHFIFNAMTAIQDYMQQGDAKSASLYLIKFSKLIRQVLDNSRSEFIGLDQEISMLDNYLSLQSLREDRPFKYKIELQDGLEDEGIAIPPMFAQPFVENAIEHGITQMNNDANIIISFSLKVDHLILRISDNGKGIEESTKIRKDGHISHATAITKERIELYRKMTKKKIAFNIKDLSPGTQVIFNLPYQYI